MEVLRLAGVGNIGGLQRCWLICLADVVELYEPCNYVTGKDADGLELPISCMKLKDVAELVELWFVPGEGNFECSVDGDVFRHKVSFEPPGDWPAIGSKLSNMRRKKWLAVMEDNNGLPRLAGGAKQGLRLDFGFNGNNRRYSVVFEASVAHDAYYLPSAVLADLTGSTSGFSFGFNFGFES